MSQRAGPVIADTVLGEAVLDALRELNPELEVVDRGGYWRAESPRRCVLTLEALRRHAGPDAVLPGDLERVMPSFRGRVILSEDRVEWHAEDDP